MLGLSFRNCLSGKSQCVFHVTVMFVRGKIILSQIYYTDFHTDVVVRKSSEILKAVINTVNLCNILFDIQSAGHRDTFFTNKVFHYF